MVFAILSVNMNYYGLIDCNNFFVSCERLFRPDLVGKPVVVLSSNDGCVVARSQEIKDIGIPMGVPYFQIKDILKDNKATVFSSNFALYRDISRRVMMVVRREIEAVEVYSIDEAFVTLEALSALHALDKMKLVKKCVEKEIGIPVSVAVAATKTQAKLVNQMAKKSTGALSVEAKEFVETFGDKPLSAVWGVGGKMERRYKEAAYHTVGDLLAADPSRVRSLFGVHGVRLQAELKGIPADTLVRESSLPHSIMSTRSFAKKTNDLSFIKDALAHHVHEVSRDLREAGLVASSLQVILETSRHGDWLLRGGRVESVLVSPSALTPVLLKEALRLLGELYESGVPYSKTGVVVRGLLPAEAASRSLFEAGEIDDKAAALQKTIDDINKHFGNDKLLVGKFAKGEALWRPKQDTLSPAYTTRWNEIATVKADRY